MNILVTGGAGYIGSHVVKHLGEKTGHSITVIDNLSTGKKEAVLYGSLVVEDLENSDAVETLFSNNNFDAVLHFAAKIEVEESVREPLKYYLNNTMNTAKLVETSARHGVKYFIFSSTAAVYGDPDRVPVTEEDHPKPLNPYGKSKLFSEQILQDAGRANKGFKYCILRYFNVAGADGEGRIGQNTPNATHLIKVACQAALGMRESVSIFGTDYDTPDGTGVRDYIHVDDLADAHLMALEYLEGNGSDIFNVGYGRGYSVREVLDAVKRISTVDFPVHETGRRAGDSARVVADNAKMVSKTGWKPNYDNLDYICETALEWERKCLKQ